MIQKFAASCVLVLTCACSWEAPLDPHAPALTNVITGTVVVNAPAVTGPVFVLLYDVNDPPPPSGTGAPVTFAAIRQADFDGGTGVQSAPFALTGVPNGDWVVTALVDQDGDFYPLVTAAAGATCGDILGAYPYDVETGDIGLVSVSGGELVENVAVAAVEEMVVERPAFVFSNNEIARDGSDPYFTLANTAIAADLIDSNTGEEVPFLNMTGPYDGTDLCDTSFLLYIPDDDGDGVADDHPNAALAAAGYPAIWPRVYMQYLGTGTVQLAEGESYVTEAYPIDPTGGLLPVNTAYPVAELNLAFLGVASHITADAEPVTVSGSAIPYGDWAVTVVSITGQVWTLPNALADSERFPSADANVYQPAAQNGKLQVQ